MKKKILEFQNLSISFQKNQQVVNNLSFSLSSILSRGMPVVLEITLAISDDVTDLLIILFLVFWSSKSKSCFSNIGSFP